MITYMALTPKVAVFDSSGLVSLVKPDDQMHGEAVSILEAMIAHGWRLLLPYEVLAESLDTIGKLAGKQSAVKVGEAILDQYAAQELAFVQNEPHVATRALHRLKSATGSPSFVDCQVMSYADEHRTLYIFGFDATFRKNGYRLPTKK